MRIDLRYEAEAKLLKLRLECSLIVIYNLSIKRFTIYKTIYSNFDFETLVSIQLALLLHQNFIDFHKYYLIQHEFYQNYRVNYSHFGHIQKQSTHQKHSNQTYRQVTESMEKSIAKISYGVSEQMIKSLMCQKPDLKKLTFVLNINKDKDQDKENDTKQIEQSQISNDKQLIFVQNVYYQVEKPEQQKQLSEKVSELIYQYEQPEQTQNLIKVEVTPSQQPQQEEDLRDFHIKMEQRSYAPDYIEHVEHVEATKQDILRIIDTLRNMHPELPFQSMLHSLQLYYTSDPTFIAQTQFKYSEQSNSVFESNSDFMDPQSNQRVRQHRPRKFVGDTKNIGQNTRYRQNLERQIAQVFVYKGYGLGLMRQALGKFLENNLYNSLLTGMLHTATRKLCYVLKMNLKVEIQPFNSPEQKKLRSPMANCRKWMEAKSLQTLFKIIAKIYNVFHTDNEPLIYPRQLLRLYNNICKNYLSYRKIISEQALHFGDPVNHWFSTSMKIRNVIYEYKDEDCEHFGLKKIDEGQNFQQFLTKQNQKPQQPNPKKAQQMTYNTTPSNYQRQLLTLYVKHQGNIKQVVQIMNKHHNMKYTSQRFHLDIEASVKSALKTLAIQYQAVRTKDRSLPELMLNDEVVYLLMSNRKDSPFRVELIRRMIGFKFDSKAKLLNLIAMLNNKVSERGLASIYHKKKSIFDTVYVDPLTK